MTAYAIAACVLLAAVLIVYAAWIIWDKREDDL